MKSSLGLRYHEKKEYFFYYYIFCEACNERRDGSPRLSGWTTRLRTNIAAVVSRGGTLCSSWPSRIEPRLLALMAHWSLTIALIVLILSNSEDVRHTKVTDFSLKVQKIMFFSSDLSVNSAWIWISLQIWLHEQHLPLELETWIWFRFGLNQELLNYYWQLPCLTHSIEGTVWRTSWQVYLLCRWERHLARFPILVWQPDGRQLISELVIMALWSLSRDRGINMQLNAKNTFFRNTRKISNPSNYCPQLLFFTKAHLLFEVIQTFNHVISGDDFFSVIETMTSKAIWRNNLNIKLMR